MPTASRKLFNVVSFLEELGYSIQSPKKIQDS